MVDIAATGLAPESLARSKVPSGLMPLDISRLIFWLRVAIAIVLGLGILREVVIAQIGTGTVLKDLRHFALDAERNLPSWFEAILMYSASLLLAANALLSRQGDRRNFVHWLILSVIFFLMSADELVSFHEVTVAPLRNSFELTGAFYFSWVLLAAPLVTLLGLYFVPFLLRLPRRTALGFIIAGAVFVGGALGTEFLLGYLATSAGMDTLVYKAIAASQECLEGIGMLLFVTALLRHLQQVAPRISLVLNP